MENRKLELATFGGGCFWCTEAIFKRIKGVKSVTSGYSGGSIDSPTYEQVSGGKTGYAESVQIKFDPTVISYNKLLQIFFATHDPTSLNRQGADIGTQYRSVIFYHDQKQKEEAGKMLKEIEKSGKYQDSIVTDITPFKNFYTAEEYHQNFYDQNPNYSYCTLVIDPKIQKLIEEFNGELKDEFKNR